MWNSTSLTENSYDIGDRVLLAGKKGRTGRIKFQGTVKFAGGIWLGIELEEGFTGNHDGEVQGERYFESPANQGVFVPASKVLTGLPDEPKKTSYKETAVDMGTVLKIDDHVILKDGRHGKIVFKGNVKSKKGERFGLIMDPGYTGKNDGSYKGRRYFKCSNGQGLFVKQNKIASRFTKHKRRQSAYGRRRSTSESNPQTSTRHRRTSSAQSVNSGESKLQTSTRHRRTSSAQFVNPGESKLQTRTRHRRTSSAQVVSSGINDFPLRKEKYFHGKMNRHEAEELVKKKGMWLLRVQKRKIYLSIRKKPHLVEHIEVKYDPVTKRFNYTNPGARTLNHHRDFEALIKSLRGKTRILIGDDPYAEEGWKTKFLKKGAIPFEIDDDFKIINTRCEIPMGSTLIKIGGTRMAKFAQDKSADFVMNKIAKSLPVEITYMVEEERDESEMQCIEPKRTPVSPQIIGFVQRVVLENF